MDRTIIHLKTIGIEENVVVDIIKRAAVVVVHALRRAVIRKDEVADDLSWRGIEGRRRWDVREKRLTVPAIDGATARASQSSVSWSGRIWSSESLLRFCLLISRLAAGVEDQIPLDDVASAKAIVKVDRGAGCWPAAACVRHNDTAECCAR